MSEPFLAEVKMVGFNFPPRGWAFCDGQLLPINQNQALFSLVGTTYGGDGRTTFGLPDLRGRTPVHVGPGYAWGQSGGAERHTLTQAQIPAHTHTARGSGDAASSALPTGNLAGEATLEAYGDAASSPVAMSAEAIAAAGSGQPHENMQPWLAIEFCIALQGVFPSRN